MGLDDLSGAEHTELQGRLMTFEAEGGSLHELMMEFMKERTSGSIHRCPQPTTCALLSELLPRAPPFLALPEDNPERRGGVVTRIMNTAQRDLLDLTGRPVGRNNSAHVTSAAAGRPRSTQFLPDPRR
jgi:hypothetical protein